LKIDFQWVKISFKFFERERMKLRHLDLFSGIGGFSLGLESTGGFETVAFCDIEKYCLQVLEKRFPGVPRYTDIKELNYDKIKSDGLFPIDIITGGYPCQPFSVAGRKKGEEDPRHLWPEMFRLVQELRPSWVIGENVSGHIKLGLDTVLKNLESEGYSARTFSISASSVGANHQRERVWIVANARQHERGFQPSGNQEGIGPRTFEKTKRSSATNKTSRSGTRKETLADTNSERGRSWETRHKDAENVGQSSRSEEAYNWWDIEPNVGRVAHGVPKRVDRLKSLGNSLVPHIPYYIGLSILRTYEKELADTT
jgi:DNA (cytosine-5)-methyltransferase 1